MGAIQSTINPYGSIWVVYDCFTNMNEIALSLGTPYDPVIASYGTGSGCQSIVGDGDHISVIKTKYDWGGTEHQKQSLLPVHQDLDKTIP